MVYREGAPGAFLYLLISGRCQSVIRLPNGSEQALDIFGPGDTFGERALLSQGTNWTSVHVVTDSVLLRLNGDDVHRAVDRTPRMAKLLVQRFRENLRSLNESVVEGACKQADVVLRPVVCDGRWNDFDDTRRFIEHGAREAEENLEALLALVDRG